VIERPERDLDFVLLLVLVLVLVFRTSFQRSDYEDEDENEDDRNKKAFIPAKQRMKALSESRPHTRNGLASSFS
jgi:hypothetical protein